MLQTEAGRRRNQCGQKVRHATVEAAQAIADQMLQDRIYDQMEPRAYQCDYGNHFHVGHSLKRIKCAQQVAEMDVSDNKPDSSPTDPLKRGRPPLEPTKRITLRLPVSTLDIIKRRADKASMVPSVWLERVIHHEVVRRHYLTKAERNK